MSLVITYLTAPFVKEHKEKVLHNTSFFLQRQERVTGIPALCCFLRTRLVCLALNRSQGEFMLGDEKKPSWTKSSEEGQGGREDQATWVENLGNFLKFLCKEMRSDRASEKLPCIQKGSVTGCHLLQKKWYTLYQMETSARLIANAHVHSKSQLCPIQYSHH